ncbi:uncharacterized protein LY79DRAFT_530423 [Colletotrichum navitas]|uniref:Uncharacterized protein n=1 Tax=Colletotrichum navitas TaxID=681940 RepID=A0AAD8UV00_9PEZI|nr:uncharacterized protein LY79DRAFT_530423 [Colletotrichum navitas]KAK1564158.1 hypothetical protein LY79DRAFT_530423 [Colletotrichum navitas]
MNLQRPPTDAECASYYNGLPSRPRLVARSSLTPFPFERFTRSAIDDGLSNRKTLAVVGDHPIVSKWNNEPSLLRGQIMDILTRHNVDWHAIDIIRIGYEDEDMPVIVWISVSAGTTWEMGNQVVHDCRDALVEHGLDDVHCEIKEARLVNVVRWGSAAHMTP